VGGGYQSFPCRTGRGIRARKMNGYRCNRRESRGIEREKETGDGVNGTGVKWKKTRMGIRLLEKDGGAAMNECQGVPRRIPSWERGGWRNIQGGIRWLPSKILGKKLCRSAYFGEKLSWCKRDKGGIQTNSMLSRINRGKD